MTNIVWLRHELRLDDNPALCRAAQEKDAVVPVYVWNPNPDAANAPGAASKWWLHHSLTALSAAFAKRGAPLLLRIGNPAEELPHIASECNAKAVFWNRAYDPHGKREDVQTETTLRKTGVACRIFAAANYLVNPDDILNNSGKPFKVFTPFWKRAATPAAKPLTAPAHLVAHEPALMGASLDALGLLPEKDWTAGLRDTWQPGEAGAQLQLQRFIENGLENYGEAREYPAAPGTSRLSPHLRFGEISPPIIADEIIRACAEQRAPQLTFMAEAFMRQLYWREFGMYLLHHFPHLLRSPMRPEFERFPWRNDPEQLKRWQHGQTGYPIVDAGMRELWRTGWMHNRVRMIAASFLVKHLLLHWQSGAAWFWDTLVDADAANNTLGWQWVSGCGPDAAPYFRIFNPTTQSERYDATGDYIRQWVPELAQLNNKHIHAPWTAPPTTLQAAGVSLGDTYPKPIIDHKEARRRALDTFAFIRNR